MTSTIWFIKKIQVPIKSKTHHTHLTVGSDIVEFSVNISTPMENFTNIRFLSNSVVSVIV